MYRTIEELELALNSKRISAKEIISDATKRGQTFRAHPLGFISCTLCIEGVRKVRLHIWPVSGNTAQDERCQIHDHIFEFKSWVLSGTIENTEYALSETGTLYSLYSTNYLGDTSILKKSTETVRLTLEKVSQHSQGASYSVPAGRLHETRRLGSKSAVTLLITKDISLDAPLVIGPLDGPARYEYVRSALTQDELFLVAAGI